MAATEAGIPRNVWTEGALAPGLPEPAAPRRAAPKPATRPAESLHGFRRGMAAIALAGAMLVAVAAGSAAVVMRGLAVSSESAAVATLQGQNRILTVRLSELQNPERIDRIATEQLGLVRPSAYVPVPAATLPQNPVPRPGHTTTEVVNVPAGPAPGGAVALWQRGVGWVQQHVRLGSGRKPS